MKWIKSYSLFESLNHKYILDDVIDILRELSDEGYKISKFNNNPPDVPTVKDSLSGINIYLYTKGYIKVEEFPNIQKTLIRIKDFLESVDIEAVFEIGGKNLLDYWRLEVDSDDGLYINLQNNYRKLDHEVKFVRIKFNVKNLKVR